MKIRFIFAQLVLAMSLAPLTWFFPVLYGNEKAHHWTLMRFFGGERLTHRRPDVAQTPKGELVSNKPPGFPLLMAPAYLATKGIQLTGYFRWTEDLEFRVLKLFIIVFPAMLFSLIVFLGMEEGGFQYRTCYLVAFTVVHSTLLLPYSTLLVSHIASAVFVLSALYFTLRHHLAPSWANGFWALFCSAFCCVIDYANVAAVFPFVLLVLWDGFRAGTLIRSLSGAAFGCLILVIYNFLTFGEVLTTSYSRYQAPSYVSWASVGQH